MSNSTPQPDEFGWFRVTDKDTGHKRSVRESELAHGNYNVLVQPASDPLTGEPLAPEYKPLSNKSGQQAGTEKESTNG